VAGIEEVAAITLHQSLLTSSSSSSSSSSSGSRGGEAVVVVVPGIEWGVVFDDPKRKEWHEEKMRGKERRATSQLQHLGLPSGQVYHVG